MSFEVAQSDLKENRKRKILHRPRPATAVVRVPSMNRVLKAVERDWFTKYVGEDSRHTSISYIVGVPEIFEAPTSQKSGVHVVSAKTGSSVRT